MNILGFVSSLIKCLIMIMPGIIFAQDFDSFEKSLIDEIRDYNSIASSDSDLVSKTRASLSGKILEFKQKLQGSDQVSRYNRIVLQASNAQATLTVRWGFDKKIPLVTKSEVPSLYIPQPVFTSFRNQNDSAAYCHTKDCYAVVTLDPKLCNIKDCAAFITGIASMCHTKDCLEMVIGDPKLCRTKDCVAYISGDVGQCYTKDCAAIVTADSSRCYTEGCTASITRDAKQCLTKDCVAIVNSLIKPLSVKEAGAIKLFLTRIY